MVHIAQPDLWKLTVHVPNSRLVRCFVKRGAAPTSQMYGKKNTWWSHPMETFSALRALCAGNSPVTGEFPAQRASSAENVSTWWRHHVINKYFSQKHHGVLTCQRFRDYLPFIKGNPLVSCGSTKKGPYGIFIFFSLADRTGCFTSRCLAGDINVIHIYITFNVFVMAGWSVISTWYRSFNSPFQQWTWIIDIP